MIKRAFTEHPASVGESYTEHMACAFSFGSSMLIGGVACLLHGLLPFLFERSGSQRIETLHYRMVTHRDRRLAGSKMPPMRNGGAQDSSAVTAAE